MFRNDFLIPAPKDLRPPQSAATSVAAEFGSESIIILDDDDDEEQEEEEDTTPKSNEVTVVEAVGQELMGLATADPGKNILCHFCHWLKNLLIHYH